jgi:hypothetical protein
MPSITPRIKTLTQLDNHTVEIQTKDNRAATIYNNLQSYDYDPTTATHPMQGWGYKIPTNKKTIVYEPGVGEMILDSTVYSSLTSEEKVIFWQWIDKAIVYGMKEYDKAYGF